MNENWLIPAMLIFAAGTLLAEIDGHRFWALIFAGGLIALSVIGILIFRRRELR